MPAQMLDSPVSEADLSVNPRDYFGAPLERFQNLGGYPFRASDGDLTRHSYVFQAIYAMGDEYGGIQLRARVHCYGDLTVKLRQWLEGIAHKAAFLYDSGLETSSYGPQTGEIRGTSDGDGYLTGFNAVQSYQNIESEPIGRSEIPHEIGVIDWSTEIYVDEDFDDAALSGISQGLANPYRSTTHTEEGREPVHVPPTKWNIGWEQSRRGGDGEYFVRAQPNTQASQRYLESGGGAGKDVLVNGYKIGSLGPKGRVWLSPEYGIGDGLEYRGNHSRKGLIKESEDATPQAIRKGGNLYQTGETTEAVHLVTARAKRPGYEAADPDQVPIDLEVQEGRPAREIHLLRVKDYDEEIEIEARRDEKVIRHMGMSDPDYRHKMGDRMHWPRGEAYSPGGDLSGL